MDETERAKLEKRILRLEKAVQQLMLTQIETVLDERASLISLLDLDMGLDQIEQRQPGLV